MPTGHIAARQRRRTRAVARRASANPLLDLLTTSTPPHSGFVPRPTLARALADAPEAKLAMIVAPAGYGKSTLLAEWAQQDDRPFFWLALRELGADADFALNLLRSRGDFDELAQLVIELQARCPSFVLVLDDAHMVDPTHLRRLVDGALRELPSGSTVAVASRTEPPLQIGRLRAHRMLREIRMPDLAMSCADARSLFELAGLEPGCEDLEAVVSRTEGWPAAIYLATLALHEDPEALSRFGGENHLISRYLDDEVLAAMPADLRTFVVRTSVLDELSGSICDEVLEEHGSAARLRSLADANPLLVPIDPAHHTYRWHSAMREALKGELQLWDAELEGVLHHRASRWFTSRGNAEQAIKHAAAAGDAELTGDLLWQKILGYVTCGRNDVVRSWLSNFTLDQISAHVPLALSGALSALVAGSLDEARDLSSAAASGLGRSSGDEPPSVRTGLAVIRAISTTDGVARMGEIAHGLAGSEPEDSAWRPICLLLRAVALHLQGGRDTAQQLLDEAIELSGNRTPGVTSLCLAQRAMIAIEQDEWELAAELTDRATMVVEEWGLKNDPLSALALASAAASRAHQGRIDEAKQDLRRGVDLLAAAGEFVPWYGAETRILLAYASLWLADVVGARTLLAEASRAARRTPDTAIFAEWFDRAWVYMDTLAETRLAGPSSLTIAELRILRFLPSHRSFREIASQLGVSANTVKTQAHAVYRKLGAASRSEAVTHAIEAGLLGQ